MYLRAAKTEAEDAGVSTDGMANSVSELRDEILKLTGNRVDLMWDDNTFKSTYQVMSDLADIWDELTDVSRANILNLIGGKRNANTFSALLENFDTAIRSTTTAVDALGSATAENEKYLDSIVGKITRFKAAFEELSSTLIDSELVGSAVDFATALLEIGTALTKIQLLLPIVTAAFSGFNVIKQLPRALMDGQSLEGMLSKFAVADPKGVPEIQAFASATQSYTQAQREMLAMTVKASSEFKAMNAAQQAAVLSNMNLTQTAVASAKGLKMLGAAAKAAWSSMSVLSKLSLIASGISLIVAAFNRISDALTTSMDEAQEYSNTLKSSIQQYQDSTATYKENIQTLTTLGKKYTELSAGVKENGENASLTDEQYREYLSVVQQIAEISPSVVSNYNSERQAIKLYDDAIQSAIGSQRELINNQRAILLGNADELFKNTAKSYKTYVAELQDQTISSLVNETILQGNILDMMGTSANEAAKEYTGAFAKALQNIGLSTDLGPNGLFSYDGWSGFLSFNLDNWNIDVIRKLYDMRQVFVNSLKETGLYTSVQISQIEQELYKLGTTLALIDTDVANRIETIWASLEDSGDLDALGSAEALNAFKEGIIHVSDSAKEFPEDLAAVKNYLTDFVDVLSSDVNGQNFTDSFKQFAQGVDFDTYTLSVEGYINSLVETKEIAESTAPALKDYLLSLYKIGDAGQTGAAGTEQVTQSILSLSDALTQIQKNNDVLAKIYADMDALGYVTADTIEAMMKQLGEGESIMDYLTLEDGMLKANAEAWRERNNNVFASELKQMQAELEALEQAKAAADAGEEFVLPDAYKDKYKDIKAVSARIVQLNADIAELQAVIDSVGGSDKRELDLGLDDLFKDTDELREKATTLLELMEQLKTDVPLTQDQIMDIGGSMPELALDLSAADTIEEQREVLASAWEGYKAQWQTIINEQIALLKRQLLHFSVGSEEYKSLTETIIRLSSMKSIDLGEVVTIDKDDSGSEKTEELYELADALDAVRNSAELLNSIQNADNLSDTIDQAEKFINDYNTAMGLTDAQALDWTELIKGFDETTGTITWDTAKIEQYSGEILNAADGLAELEVKFPGITSYLKTTATSFEEAADSAADLGNVLDAIGNATEFRAAMADGETDILSMLEQAQAMADAYNEIKHPDSAEWDWTTFANNLDTAESIEDIEWSEDALRDYTDAVIDNYAATTNLAETNPELITQWKDMAYAAAQAAEEADHLSGALDAISNVQGFIAGMQDKDTSVFDMIEQAQAMAEALNEMDPDGHGGAMYTWENFAKGLEGAQSMADIQWNKDALRAYVNAMVDAYAKDTKLSAQAIQNWKDMAFAQAEAAIELQNYTDILSSMTSAGDLMKQIELDMDDDGLLTLDTLSSLISMVGDKWMDMVTITKDGFSMKAADSVVAYLKSEIDALVAAGELDQQTADATKAAFDAMIARGGETISVYDKLSDVIGKVETASSLLTDIESGEGDILSMIQTAAEIAEDGGYSLTDLFSVVGGEFEWSTDIIEKWAETAIDGLEGVAGVTPELIAEIKELVAAEVEAAVAAEKMQAAYSNVSTALTNRPSMGDYTELTYDAYNELIKADARYASAVEYQNGVLTLNRDAYNKVTQSLLQITKAEAAANMQTILMSQEYANLVTAIGKLSPEQQQRLDDLNAEIMGYQVLIHELENATNAYNRFMSASTDTDSERYSAAESMRKVIEDTLYNTESDMYGKIGREQFTAAVDFLIDPNVDIGTKEFDDALERIDRYLTEGSEGVTNFYNDLVSEGFIVDGRLDASLQEMASGLGISMDFLRSMIDELNLYQTEENKIKVSADTGEVQEEAISAEKQLELLQKQALELNETLDVNHTIVIDISAAEASIGKVSSGLATLLSRLAQIGKTKVTASVGVNTDLSSDLSGSTTNSSSSGGNWLSKALGSLFGKSSAGGTGYASGGRTLVGERGREIVVDPTSGTWYTVGDRGPEFVNLPEGAIVFNNLQTEELLARGRTSGTAMAEGNAASGGLLDGLKKLGSAVGKVFSGALSDAVAQVAKDKGINTSGSGAKSDKASGTPEMPTSGSGNKKNNSGSGSKKPSLEDMQKEIEEQLNYVEHLIRHQEHLYEVSSHALDFPGMEASLSEQIRLYKQMMAEAQAAVQKLIAAGADDTSEEVQAIEETYWSAYDSLYDVIEQVNKLYVDGLNDKIDGIQGAYSNFTEMIGEMGENGSISVDMFQQLLDHGVQYLNYLDVVNGQYVINEEAIQDLIAAEKEQLAIEQALAYIAQIRQALTDDDPQKVANLVNLTNEISGNTWDLVYASAALLKTMGLSDEQYADVLHNIDMMFDLSQKVNTSLKDATEEYEKQGDALDRILELTQDMIKYETEERIEAIENEIDAYNELIELKKEALQTAKEESDYSEDVAERVKEIAKLQAEIDQLSLDDSRAALVERAAKQEELLKLQKELGDVQSDHALDSSLDALDKSAEQYETERNTEIEMLENRISSAEKLYQAALQRIDQNWSTLYSDLIGWNTQAGNVLNSEITQNWELALQAAQRYGSYVDAVVARTGNPMVPVSYSYGPLPRMHTGGVVGAGGIDHDEVVTVLEKGEEVLTEKQRFGLYRIVDFAKELSDRLGTAVKNITNPIFGATPAIAGVGQVGGTVVSNETAYSFSPVITVNLNHSGDMSGATARSYGKEIGEIAMQEMREAFMRRGVGGVLGSNLKQ